MLFFSPFSDLPINNIKKNTSYTRKTQRCPTGAIVWLEKDGKVVKGGTKQKGAPETATA